MRKLFSVHNISDSPAALWEHGNAFVAYLLVGRQEARYREHIENFWMDYDLMTGDYLYVVVTSLLPDRQYEEDIREILAKEHQVTEELLEKFNLTFQDLPCLLFLEGPNSKRYFCYDLSGGAPEDEGIAQRFRTIFSACKRHWPGYQANRSEEKFAALCQELRAQKGREMLGPIVGDLTPKFALMVMKKLAGL